MHGADGPDSGLPSSLEAGLWLLTPSQAAMAEHQLSVPGGVVGPLGMLGPARPAELQLQPSPEQERHAHMLPNNNNNSAHTHTHTYKDAWSRAMSLSCASTTTPAPSTLPGLDLPRMPPLFYPPHPPLLHPAGSLCGLISGEIGELQAQAHTHTYIQPHPPPLPHPHPPIHIQLANCRLRHSSADTSA